MGKPVVNGAVGGRVMDQGSISAISLADQRTVCFLGLLGLLQAVYVVEL